MYNVTVFMSAYKGEKYIEEQINSIFNQKNCNVLLKIRDDGSPDNTIRIIESLDYSNIDLIKGNNLGFGKSFLTLVCNDDSESEFYAFSDQDDVWLDEKLCRACQILELEEGPALYCGTPIYVDSELKPISGNGGMLDELPIGKIESKQVICLGIFGLGCTYVWNKKFQDIIKKKDITAFPFSHDNFLSVLAACVGIVYKDQNRYFLYRQHSNNVSGNKNNKKTKNIFLRIIKGLSRQSKLNKEKNDTAFETRKCILEEFANFIRPDIKVILRDSINYRKSFLSKIRLLKNNLAKGLDIYQNMKLLIRIITKKF